MEASSHTKHHATIEFDNSFEVPMTPEKAWPALSDIRHVAACVPGVDLTKAIDDRDFEGRFSVPLGPITLAFSGLVRVEELDSTNRRARISARGSEVKDHGGAGGVATFEVSPDGDGSKVSVHTKINLSGMAARYAENVNAVQATAEKILTDFANNLEARITERVGV